MSNIQSSLKGNCVGFSRGFHGGRCPCSPRVTGPELCCALGNRQGDRVYWGSLRVAGVWKRLYVSAISEQAHFLYRGRKERRIKILFPTEAKGKRPAHSGLLAVTNCAQWSCNVHRGADMQLSASARKLWVPSQHVLPTDRRNLPQRQPAPRRGSAPRPWLCCRCWAGGSRGQCAEDRPAGPACRLSLGTDERADLAPSTLKHTHP